VKESIGDVETVVACPPVACCICGKPATSGEGIVCGGYQELLHYCRRHWFGLITNK
jgi:hypothetical protein